MQLYLLNASVMALLQSAVPSGRLHIQVIAAPALVSSSAACEPQHLPSIVRLRELFRLENG